ncbi:MAG: PQQ-binding-like beta-propeller repeat protein [Proteobacteria bacterium]|nr:PQQ-binding-like beta-propeller repeat protein [Pseudomonadota bacterium]
MRGSTPGPTLNPTLKAGRVSAFPRAPLIAHAPERRLFARVAAAAAILLTLAGCSDGLWFGERAKPPLPGNRISVLAHEQSLKPDAATAGTEILLPPPSANPEWPQAGGYANHAMHHLDMGDAPALLWDADIGTGASDARRLVAEPVVALGRVFAVDAENQVSAYDANTGRQIWQRDVTPRSGDKDHMSGGVAVGDGLLFVATGFGHVVALDPADGTERWRTTLGGPVRTAPTANGGRVFVVTVDNKTRALDAQDGKILWTHDALTETVSLLGGASPAVDAGIVVVPYSSGELVALRVDSGRVLWSDNLAVTRRTDVISTLAQIRGRPVVDRGRVYAMSHGEMTVAFDLRTGRRLWERRMGGLSNPWVAGDYLFALSRNNDLIALSRGDGRIFWMRALPVYENVEKRLKPIIWSGPVLAGDRLIVVGSHGEAWAVSPYSGEVLGRIELDDGLTVPPVLANGTLYFLSADATLSAYR